MYKRKIKLIKSGLQLRLTLSFVAVGLAGALLQYTLFVNHLNSLGSGGTPGEAALLGGIATDYQRQLILVITAMVPLTVLVGVFVTFTVAGPLYRLERYFERIANGDDPGPCRLRQNDEMQELCALINQAVDQLRGQEHDSPDELPSDPVAAVDQN